MFEVGDLVEHGGNVGVITEIVDLSSTNWMMREKFRTGYQVRFFNGNISILFVSEMSKVDAV
jgi:hypothetical protein